MLLEHIEHNTADNPDACIIWLHGLGADGHDFAGMVPELQLPVGLRLRFIFPHAPFRPITLNNGYVMRGWYDIYGLQLGNREDAVGIMDSAEQIVACIEREEARGVARQRIILAGFSQGGAIALYTGLRLPGLGGIMALSTYVPLVGQPLTDIAADRRLPLFMAHGIHDDIIAPRYAIQSRLWLQQQGFAVDWHEYPMAHSVCMDEVADIRAWLLARLS